MVPYKDGTQGHKIKNKNHPRHRTQYVMETKNIAQSFQENAIRH